MLVSAYAWILSPGEIREGHLTLVENEVELSYQVGNVIEVVCLHPFHSPTSQDLRSGGLGNSDSDEFYFTTGHNVLKPTDLKSSKISLVTWAHSAG
jgi:hypothetical protein